MLSLLDSVTAIPTIIYLIIIVGILRNGILPMTAALTISILLRLIKFVMVLSEDEQKRLTAFVRNAWEHLIAGFYFSIFCQISCMEL